jgi:hypothetical protein
VPLALRIHCELLCMWRGATRLVNSSHGVYWGAMAPVPS